MKAYMKLAQPHILDSNPGEHIVKNFDLLFSPKLTWNGEHVQTRARTSLLPRNRPLELEATAVNSSGQLESITVNWLCPNLKCLFCLEFGS
jgi:hypothetical protein